MSFLRLTLGLQMASFFVTNLLKKCYLMIPISFSHQKHCQTTVLSLYVKCYLMMPISFSMSHDQKHCQTTVGIPLLPLICVTTLKICLSPIYFESFIWNMDEQGIQMGGGRKNSGKGYFYHQISSDNLELVTVTFVRDLLTQG